MNNLNVRRLWQLIKIDLSTNRKLISMTAILLIIFFALLPFHFSESIGTYLFVLYVGGFIVTSHAFNDLHDPKKGYYYLTLPCSNLEKFLSKWLMTSIGYALSVLLIYYVFSILSMLLNKLVFGYSQPPLNLMQTTLWIGIGKYFILQSIVLLGAIFFKRHVLIKTALSLSAFFIAIGLTVIVATWMFYPLNIATSLIGAIMTTLKGGYFIFWILLAPFCWYITYVRLCESEIR